MIRINCKGIKIAPKNSNRMHLPTGAVHPGSYQHHSHNGSTILNNSNAINISNNTSSNNNNSWQSSSPQKGGMLEETPPSGNNNNNSTSSSNLSENFLRWLEPLVHHVKEEFPGELGKHVTKYLYVEDEKVMFYYSLLI